MSLQRLRPMVPGSLFALLLTTLPLSASAGEAPAPHRLDVQARTELQVVPDRAILSARLWERTPAIAQREDTRADPEALAEARTRLEDRAAVLIRTLEDAGLARGSIRAGSLRVQPETLYERPHDDGEPTPLVRTRLERPFRVELEDLEQLPMMLDALTAAGVNALDGVTYDLADRDAATDRALSQALERARHKAELMAETLGVELGTVLAVSENQAPVFQPRMMAMSADARERGGAAEYRSGTITIDAAVGVSWEIEDEKSEE